MYTEDVDLAFKLRAAGYKNYYVPQATVIHHGGQSSKQPTNAFAPVMMKEATFRFLRWSRGPLYGLAYRLAMLSSAIARLGLLIPAWIVCAKPASLQGACRKWVAVLQWSVKRDGIVKQFYGVRNRSVPLR
jgi:GT2 family glycosyltransferase